MKLGKLEVILLTVKVSLILAVFWAVSLWTDSNLEWVLSKLSGEAVEVPQALSFLITLVLNAAAVAFNIIISLIKLVM